jgi:hypothetical protein
MTDYRSLIETDEQRRRASAEWETKHPRVTYYTCSFGDDGQPSVKAIEIRIRPNRGWGDSGGMDYDSEDHANRNGFFRSPLLALQDAERRAEEEHARQVKRLSWLYKAIREAQESTARDGERKGT